MLHFIYIDKIHPISKSFLNALQINYTNANSLYVKQFRPLWHRGTVFGYDSHFKRAKAKRGIELQTNFGVIFQNL